MNSLKSEEKIAYLELYALQQARIDRYSLLAARNADKSLKYKEKINAAIAVRDIIEEDIESLENKKESEVLAQKYLCGKTFAQTADMLNYSRRQIERIHMNGLENLRPSTEKLIKAGGRIRRGKNNTSL